MTTSYTTPARVKTLFLPLDDLPQERFFSYFTPFRAHQQIRLVDVTPKDASENAVNKFSPQGFPLGSVLYDHQLSGIENQEIFLQDFEPFRKIFVVVGFVETLTPEKLALHLKNLKKVFKYLIVHSIVVFGQRPDPEYTNPNVFFADPSKDTSYSVMCDITSCFLDALGSYALSFQHVTLRSPGSINSNDVLKVTPTNHTSLDDPQVEVIRKTPTKGNEKIKELKNKGRHSKILGNFYLLAGRYVDALREFGEALTLLKSSNDHLWLANALEYIGICLVLLSQINVPYLLPPLVLKFIKEKEKEGSVESSPRNSMSRSGTMTSISSVSAPAEKMNLQVPEIVNQLTNKLLALYAQTFANHEDYVPQLVYCETILRFVRFMAVVHVSDGFTSAALDHMVLGHPLGEKKANEFFFSKNEIFRFLNRVFTTDVLKLSLTSQCRLYATLASVYDDLGLYRKKTFVLRTLFSLLVPELKKMQKTAVASLEEDDELLTRLAEIFERDQQLQTQVELNSRLLDSRASEPNAQLVKLLQNLVMVYGIGTLPKSLTNNHRKTPWFHIHKFVLLLCIDMCKAIIDFGGIVLFSSILLLRYLHTLTKEEQITLNSLIKETQQKAKNVNRTVPCTYWDPFLVRDVSLLNEFDESLMPIKLTEVPKGANTTIDAPDNSLGSKKGQAVIYNPFEESKRTHSKSQRRSLRRLSGIYQDKAKEKSETNMVDASIAEEEEVKKYEDVIEDSSEVLLVQNEIFTVLVKVQNPFRFEIELSEISIETDGVVSLETLVNNNQNHFTINPTSVTTLRVAVRPLNYGELKIIGALIKVNSCEKQLFKVVYKEKYEVLEKVKKIGVDANISKQGFQDLTKEEISDRVEFKNLNLTVISPQPILLLSDLSLNNGWIMLLEGEKASFKILLKNLLDIKINYLAFSFLDLTIEPLTKALQLRDLPVNEIYEIEYYLLKRKPLRIQKAEINKLKYIKPLDFLNLSFDIKGKRGMRDAHVILDYGNQAEDQEARKYLNYFRRISIPISVTVSPSVELAGCDLIPLFNGVNTLNEERIGALTESMDMKGLADGQKNIWSYLNRQTKNIGSYCLLVIDLRNLWNQKFRVTLRLSDFVFPTSEEFDSASENEKATFSKTDEDCYTVSETIAPGHTERFILPIKRIEFSSEYLERAIPSLRNRQFVVQDGKHTKEEYKFIREAFWYRKELLRHIKGRWVEEGSKREGYIELRGIRLSQRMVSVLRIEKVGIEMTVLDGAGNPLKNNGLFWEVEPETFVTVRTKVTNRSNYVLRGFLRHVPTASGNVPLDRRILYNGVLQLNVGQEGIKPGESKEFDLGMVILERGEYEWGAIFDEQLFDQKQSVDLQHIQRVPLFLRAE